MGGRLSSTYDDDKQYIADLRRIIASDAACYAITAQQAQQKTLAMQSLGRTMRGGKKMQTMSVLSARNGAGKTMLFNRNFRIEDDMSKDDENNDISNVDIDYIGELVIDTRSYDVDEEDMGIIVLDSSVISLNGGITTELQHIEILSSEYIPKLLGIDRMDECEVEIGVFRYVFGFSLEWQTGFDIFDMSGPDKADKRQPQLISKHKYPFSEEKDLDKHYAEIPDS